MELSERKKQILRAVVNSYIDTGEPAGSKYIAGNYGISLSSATIRNEMAELEDLGYLEQPHTSAGRIPSTLGFREYVNNLMDMYNLTVDEVRTINDSLSPKLTQLDSIIEQAGRLMSQLSNLTAVALMPKPSEAAVTRFEIVPVEPYSFLLVMICSNSTIKTRHVRVSYEMNADVLRQLVIVLNEGMAGKNADAVSLPVIMAMERAMGAYSPLINPILKVVYSAISEDDRSQLFVEGINNLLKYPEYHDVNKAREIIELFEQKEPLVKMLDTARTNAMNVFIGDEHTITSLGDTSLVFKTFEAGDNMVGAIGVMGPKRMDYSKVIARLEYFSHNIKGLIAPADSSDDEINNST